MGAVRVEVNFVEDAEKAAVRIVDLAGPKLRLAVPVAIGKPNHLLNALYRLVESDKQLSLEIFTGLTLLRPRLPSGLELRYGGPIIEAVFKDYPELGYANAMRDGQLPGNIKVHEFFLQAGAWLNNPTMQQEFVSLGYSAVASHLRRLEINVFAQLVAPDPAGGGKFSLSSNPDIALDMTGYIESARKSGKPIAVAGEINANLPFMPGEAEVDPGAFDVLLAQPEPHFPLLALPREAVPLANYASALRIATLIKDGGTLQIGIGAFADAVTQALILRHTRNADFKAMLASLGMSADAATETEPFQAGLYACSEMLVDGFLALKRAGVLKRRVPVFNRDGLPTGAEALVHAGFFFGHKDLYETLRQMPRSELELIRMTGISFPNTLFGQEALKRSQRAHARFVNSGMIATLLGSVSSDQLADGRVVSGVGGQHDFAVMGQELEGARSIIAIRATRKAAGRTTSNIVWQYANATLPRHLRDVIVTEYGIADLRGANDRETISAMLAIADQDFQPGLRQQAIRAGKLPRSWRPSEDAARNTAATIEAALGPFRQRGLLPVFPFGTELSDVEQNLVEPLEKLKSAGPLGLARLAGLGLLRAANADNEASALERLGLAKAVGFKTKLMQALVLGALRD